MPQQVCAVRKIFCVDRLPASDSTAAFTVFSTLILSVPSRLHLIRLPGSSCVAFASSPHVPPTNRRRPSRPPRPSSASPADGASPSISLFWLRHLQSTSLGDLCHVSCHDATSGGACYHDPPGGRTQNHLRLSGRRPGHGQGAPWDNHPGLATNSFFSVSFFGKYH